MGKLKLKGLIWTYTTYMYLYMYACRFSESLSTAFPRIDYNQIIMQSCTHLQIHTNFPEKMLLASNFVDGEANHQVKF